MHEEKAIEAYVTKTSNNVQKIGLYLLECGFLGSTADEVIFPQNDTSPGALEVKCPYKHRDATVEEMIKSELLTRKD